MPPSRSSTSPIPSRCFGACLGQQRRGHRQHRLHLLLVAAEGAADRQPVDACRGDPLGGLAAQVLVDAALDDAEDRLARRPLAPVPLEAAVEPAVGALGRAGGVLAVGVEGGALVEDEGDVGAEGRLDLHRYLRRDEQLGAVAIGLEARALLGDLDPGAVLAAGAAAALDLVGDAAVGQREDLEAAGVGDQRPFPAHEAVQPAGGGDPLRPRRDEQVVGVAEDQLVAELGDLLGFEPAHRPLRRQRDEGRRLDRPVRRVDNTRARRPIPRPDLEPQPLRFNPHRARVVTSSPYSAIN